MNDLEPTEDIRTEATSAQPLLDIEDLQTQVLTQYFMLTFSYKLKNFGKAPERKRQGAGGREGMPWN